RKGDDDLSERNGQEKEEGASNKEDDQNVQDFRAKFDNFLVQQKEGYANNTNRVSTINPSISATGQGFDNADDQERIDSSTEDVNTAGPSINTANENINTGNSNINTASPIPNDPSMQSLEATGIFDDAYDDREEMGAEADLNNLETTMNVSSIPTTKIHKYHPIEQITIRNKARLVAQGYTQEEGIDYGEVFAPVARIEAIMLFLAYASFMGLIVYQMDVKSAFLYGTIEEDVYVCQPPSFEDLQFHDKVYKVEKALYGLHQAPKAWTEMMHKRFQMSSMGELTFFLALQVMQKDDGIFIIQDKYVADILKKFDFVTVKTARTPIETNKALLKDKEAKDVDVHLYRSMIGSLMYLIASRP
ncbi:putative ribonuclease H-like domain-containing protein, partial [Tanacetum coccineum]